MFKKCLRKKKIKSSHERVAEYRLCVQEGKTYVKTYCCRTRTYSPILQTTRGHSLCPCSCISCLNFEICQSML